MRRGVRDVSVAGYGSYTSQIAPAKAWSKWHHPNLAGALEMPQDNSTIH